MKLTRRDLPKLWLPAGAMFALLVIAALLAWTTHDRAEKAAQEMSAALSARNQTEQRLRQVRTEEQEIKDRSQMLQRLRTAGIAGEEKRLDWVEMLRDLQREMRIPGMKYEFGARMPIDGGNETGWYASPMRIQLRLLHEEDLLNLLKRIEKEAQALVMVRSCKLSPLSSATDASVGIAQLAAECEMQWLTVRNPGEKS